ncbi:aminotransferase class III-fold pyridoxal phosphate-dependent enzyme [bacterium]|nr:aminotransferase class III-fold pyridoxal phosphate-dependent enzyme [bacterium]
MDKLARLDHAHVWHPFTQMKDWLRAEPIVITRGKGSVLEDQRGWQYIDGNSTIWTNLHGHNHPKINAAIKRQLGKIAHSSALGLANEPASLLAAELVKVANPAWLVGRRPRGALTLQKTDGRGGNSSLPGNGSAEASPYLNKCFFSDDGSTALEVALKLAYEFTRRTRGLKAKPRFLSLEGAYHGDTIGAVSLGHIDLFHKAYGGMLFKSDRVMAPYCYRCPFNKAKPERADAREHRKCNWECVDKVEQAFEKQKKRGNPYAGFVFEPLMQGAAGMIPQPSGWLNRVAEIARGHGALLIADEVMTGFGRVGQASRLSSGVRLPIRDSATVRTPGKSGDRQDACPTLFASHIEDVQPDFLCLAKGLTGGYLPMAATLTTQTVFDVFLGEYEEFKTFFHGHSYTANQLGAAAGLASLEILLGKQSNRRRAKLENALRNEIKSLWRLPAIGDIRQTACVVGVELVKDWRSREPFDLRERAGIRVCEALAKRGVLTRPIGNVIVLMPPYCTTATQVHQMVSALAESIEEMLPQ